MKNIPVLHVEGKTLAETYEKSLLELWKNGVEFKTQYDKPGDPLSKDCTMNMTTLEPDSDPMIHKCFPGGISDLREYVFELMGIKDNWIKNYNIPDDTRWEYTYSGRLRHWGRIKYKINNDNLINWMGENINQINIVIEKLIKQPFTRQAQMITWDPRFDTNCYDPACLQSIWFRLLEDNGIYYLNTNIRFRSNDAFSANFMNQFGFIQFIKQSIIKPIQDKTNWNIKMGRLNWQADSYHIYGKDLADFKTRFLDRVETTSFEDRIYNFNDTEIQMMYSECENELLEKFKNTESQFKEIIK
jgi:thymidylate synthase